MTKEENNKIEYVLWDGMRVSEVAPWISEALNKKFDEIGAIMRYKNRIDIITPSGTLTANEGDYIIKIENGELFPCNPILFASLNNNANLRLSEQQSKHEQEMKDFAEYVHKFGYVNCSRGWYNNVADLYANKMISTTELLTKFKNR